MSGAGLPTAGCNEALRTLVARSALLLDREDFAGWLALFAREFRYAIHARSPELRRDMVWMDLDRAAMEALFRTLPSHERDPGELLRQVAVATIEPASSGAIEVSSTVLVVRTAPSGQSALFAAGRYEDQVVEKAGQWRIASRRVLLSTRMFPSDSGGSHLPL